MDSRTSSQGRRASADERSRLVSLFRASGLSQADFARRHGLKLGTFRQWLYRKDSKSKTLPQFQEFPAASLLPSSWAAEIVLGSGPVLRLNGPASADWVASVLAALRSHSC